MNATNMNTVKINTLEQFTEYITLVSKCYGNDWATQAQAEFLKLAKVYGSKQAAADVQLMVSNLMFA